MDSFIARIVCIVKFFYTATLHVLNVYLCWHDAISAKSKHGFWQQQTAEWLHSVGVFSCMVLFATRDHMKFWFQLQDFNTVRNAACSSRINCYLSTGRILCQSPVFPPGFAAVSVRQEAVRPDRCFFRMFLNVRNETPTEILVPSRASKWMQFPPFVSCSRTKKSWTCTQVVSPREEEASVFRTVLKFGKFKSNKHSPMFLWTVVSSQIRQEKHVSTIILSTWTSLINWTSQRCPNLMIHVTFHTRNRTIIFNISQCRDIIEEESTSGPPGTLICCFPCHAKTKDLPHALFSFLVWNTSQSTENKEN